MANQKISARTTALSLVGTEYVPIIDGVLELKATTQMIADLGGLAYTAENAANKDTDVTLAANSDTKYPSQKAIKAYVNAIAGGGIVTVKVSISSVEILALFTAPKTIVAAPGVGKLIRPIAFTITFNYISAAYSCNNFLFQIGSITPLGTVALNAVAGDSVFMLAPPLNTIITAADDWTNAALILKCQSSNPTLGDGTLEVYATYLITTL